MDEERDQQRSAAPADIGSVVRREDRRLVFSRVRPVYLPAPRYGLATYLLLVLEGDARLLRLGTWSDDVDDVEAERHVADFVTRLRQLTDDQQRQFFTSVDENSDPYVRLEHATGQGPSPQPFLPADLHMEDDAGDNVVIVDSVVIEQVGLTPGTWTTAGTAEGSVDVLVTRVELLDGADGTCERMLVAFRQRHLLG